MLASFGPVDCAVLAWVLAWVAVVLGTPVLAGILAFLALVAVVDLFVIQRRRRQRRLHGEADHSLFE